MKYYLLFFNIFFILLVLPSELIGQFHHDIFPSLEGQNLLQSIRQSYSPNNTLPSNEARDFLYSDIYNNSNFISCVYSGFTIQIDPNLDPSSDAFDKGINAEHTMPRSLLEGSGNEFDLHNLYPTRVEVNAARNTFPFQELNDNTTSTWFYLDTEQNSIPENNIDLYSEWTNFGFEPREDHKGNVARTMFYAYTMYNDAIENNAPLYFESQIEDLCLWHIQDPVDALEYDRTFLIADLQDTEVNPFVLDCTIPLRSYCQEYNFECELPPTVSSIDPIQRTNLVKLAFQNPISSDQKFEISAPQTTKINVYIFNSMGHRLFFKNISFDHQNTQELYIPRPLPKGIHSIYVEFQTSNGQLFKKTKRFIKL